MVRELKDNFNHENKHMCYYWKENKQTLLKGHEELHDIKPITNMCYFSLVIVLGKPRTLALRNARSMFIIILSRLQDAIRLQTRTFYSFYRTIFA